MIACAAKQEPKVENWPHAARVITTTTTSKKTERSLIYEWICGSVCFPSCASVIQTMPSYYGLKPNFLIAI